MSDRLDVRVDRQRTTAPRDGVAPAPLAVPRAYPFRQPLMWWTRRRGYVLYMVRELSSVPVAIWMILFLIELSGLRKGYQPFGAWFAVVSVICLAFALWHSYTFLNLAGAIMRIPLGERNVPARAIVTGAFGAFVVVTVVVGGLMIWGGV